MKKVVKSNQDVSGLNERKVVRRSLIAGIGGLGAARPETAEAAATPLLYPTAVADGAITNTTRHQTILKAASDMVPNYYMFYADASAAPTTIAGLFSGGDGNAGVNGATGLAAVGGAGGSGATGGVGLTASGGSPGVKAGDGVRATSTSGKGVYGQSTSSDGVHGHSVSGVGLRGTSQGNVGLVGISDTSIGLYGYNQIAGTPAFYAENLAPSGNRVAGYFNGNVLVQGNFTVLPGYAKSAAVTMPDGSEAVVYCQESPEPYFEDFGRAQLVNGVARVRLEPEFASIVKREDYMVFPVPEGDTKGLFVSQRDGQGFEVREQQGGTSNARFTYRIVARRKDIEGKRLERLDPSVKQNLAKLRGESASRMPPGAGQSEAPLVPHGPIRAEPGPEPPKVTR